MNSPALFFSCLCLICFNVQVEGIEVHANEGGVTKTRGGIYWIILPAGCNMLSSLLFAFSH